MKRHLLDRLLVTEISGYFFFGVALFTTILVAMTELNGLTQAVVQNGVPVWAAIKLFLFSLPRYMAMAFPMSMLLCTLLGFGRLSGDSETTALVAAGVSYTRMAAPIAVVGVVVSFVAVCFNEVVTPLASSAKEHLYNTVLAVSMPSKHAFHFQKVVNGRVVFTLDADNYDGETKKLLHPKLAYYDQNGAPVAVEWAEWGRWRSNMSWELHDGHIRSLTNPVTVDFPVQTTSVGVSLDQLLTASQDPDTLTYRQLQSRIEREEKENPGSTQVNTDRVALYTKIAIPFASFPFALVGFPLGLRRQRSGKAAGFALSVAIIFIYYLVYQYASVLGDNGALSPLMSAWIPDILGLILGVILVRRASV